VLISQNNSYIVFIFETSKNETIIYSHIFEFNILFPDFAKGCAIAECAKCEESGD
jgi:hypothetical protein